MGTAERILRLYVSPSFCRSWEFALPVPETGGSSLMVRTPAPEPYRTEGPKPTIERSVDLSAHQMGYLRSLLADFDVGAHESPLQVCDGTGYVLILEESGEQETSYSWRSLLPDSWNAVGTVVKRFRAWSDIAVDGPWPKSLIGHD